MTKTSQDSVLSLPLGLHKGFIVTKLDNKDRPMNRKARTSNRVREIRKLMDSVTQLSPFEKRILELFKMGVQKVNKRAFKLLKRRLCTRTRATKKQQKIADVIKAMARKAKKADEKKAEEKKAEEKQ